MENKNWIADFVRESLYGEGNKDSLYLWGNILLKHLRETKPDQNINIFAFSRIAKTPNFLIASTSERFPNNRPIQIQVTEKTADLFLTPRDKGVRMLSVELPMEVYYYSNEEPPRRFDLNFYEAISFDSENYSIVFGLVLNDLELNEFLLAEEISELFPLIRSVAFPLYSLLNQRVRTRRLEEEVSLLSNMMRESHPELQKYFPESDIKPKKPVEKNNKKTTKSELTPGLMLYSIQELRDCLLHIMAITNKSVEMAGDLGTDSPLIQNLLTAKPIADHQNTMIRNLANYFMLLMPEVKIQPNDFSLQEMVYKFYTSAEQIATQYGAKVRIEEAPVNPIVSGDQSALLGLMLRMFESSIINAPNATYHVRYETESPRTENKYVLLEIEDNGECPATPTPDKVLESLNHQVDHPRFKNGAGISFVLMTQFMTKSGGKFHLALGSQGGLSCQIFLPLVGIPKATTPPKKEESRMELETRGL
jgi:signal transduction histidine kinase